MRGEMEHSDDGGSQTEAAGRRVAPATLVGPVRGVAHTLVNGEATIDRASLTRIRLDEDGRTIRPGLRSNGGV